MKLPNLEKYYTTADSLRYGKFSLDNLLLEEKDSPSTDTPQVQMFIHCDSKYFREMFGAVVEPNSHYITYANDEIIQHSMYRHSVLPLEKVAVIMKTYNRQRSWCVSEIAHKVSNLVGLPTAYCRSLKVGNDTMTLTADYVKYGEYFFTLKDFFAYNDKLNSNSLRAIVNKIKNDVRDLQRGTKIPSEERVRLAKEFVPFYFFRKYIISDSAFTGDKVGIIYNTHSRHYCWAPCYDMEDSFGDIKPVLNKLEQDVETAISLYPNTMKNIIINYEKILQEDNIFNLLKNDLSSSDAFIFSRIIKHRILLIINIYNYFCR